MNLKCFTEAVLTKNKNRTLIFLIYLIMAIRKISVPFKKEYTELG
jgi:hypothetical protein